MKYRILLLFFCFDLYVFAQRIQNANYSTLGYITSDGKVQDANYRTLGYIATEQLPYNRLF
jgi:hypothetical protein